MRQGLADPVVVDGSRGEGGGQILRSSLALSIVTGRPLQMHRIRAGRAKPGLRRQHVACVHAAARLCHGAVTGAEVGSQQLELIPSPSFADVLDIDIGSAGSTSLVVQTVLVPALLAGHPVRLSVTGGTHNPLAPPFDFLDRVFVPHLHAMGADVSVALERHGFATGGGGRDSHDDVAAARGRITVATGPSQLRPIELIEAGPVTARRATAILSRLPTHVADRELARVRDRLGFAPSECETREVAGAGTANLLLIEVERAAGPGRIARELVTGFGEKGLRAELVADRACDELAEFLGSGVPVGAHLADQLLLPLALAGGGRFRCAPLSLHATTNIDTIRMFLDVPIRVDPVDQRSVMVEIG